MGLKSFIQRGKRGWADDDTWSLDYYLSGIIIGSLKYLKEHNVSTEPPNKDVDAIIRTFELHIEAMDKPDFKILKSAEYKKGWRLFQKYFGALWI